MSWNITNYSRITRGKWVHSLLKGDDNMRVVCISIMDEEFLQFSAEYNYVSLYKADAFSKKHVYVLLNL